MKTIWKKFALLGTLLCATLSFGILAACGEDEGGQNPPPGGDESTEITYTVYVKYPNGDPVADEDTYVQWCTQTGMCYTPVALDANGKAAYSLEPGIYDVHVILSNSLKNDYTYDSDAYKTNAAGDDITITLTAKTPTPPQFDQPTKGTGAEGDAYVVTEGRYRAYLTETADTVYYSFSAAKAGVYTVSADSELKVVIDGAALKNGEFTVDALQVNTAFEFTVTLEEGETYPAEIPVIFARKGDITEKPERTVEVEAIQISNISADATELIKVGFDATVVADDNGVYRLGTKDGAYVFVQLGNPVAPFSKALKALDAEEYVFETEDEHADDLSYPVITKDYNLMIKGAPYENIPGYMHVLDDNGVCVLTEELAEFLQYFAAGNAATIKGSSDTPDSALWLFALYTYAPATAINVETLYNEETGEPTGNPIELKANVPAGGKVYYSIQTRFGGEFTVTSSVSNAKAIYDGDEYSGTSGFEFNATVYRRGAAAVFAVTTTNGAAAEITFTVADASVSGGDGSALYPYVAKEETFTVNGTESQIFDGVYYVFTPVTSGTYKISSTDSAAWITSPANIFDSQGEGSGFEITVVLEAGTTYELVFNHQDMSNSNAFSFSVTIEKVTA